MAAKLTSLLRTYVQLESQLPVRNVGGDLAGLVTANGNSSHPIQRWFRFKEAFSLDLLEAVLTDAGIRIDSLRRVLDPFCGVGTTMLACQRLARKYGLDDLRVYGFERNPFLHFVSDTKQRWHEFDRERFRQLSERLVESKLPPASITVPELVTLRRPEVFRREMAKRLLGLRERILGFEEPERDLLLLGYANTLEAVSGVRKDGRALRIEPDKKRPKLLAALRASWNAISEDLGKANETYKAIPTRVILGDGRTLRPDAEPGSQLSDVDLVFFSPPYLNNIDYTEVYKIEAWMCGFIKSQQEFRKLREQTLRSHPSVRFRQPIAMESDARMTDVLKVLDVLVSVLPKDRHLAWRTEVFKAYFDDLYTSLKRQLGVLSPEGRIVCVLGNSLHGPQDDPQARVPVAADIITALVAQSVGLEVTAINLARTPRRRSPFMRHLRESVLVMKKRAESGTQRDRPSC